MGNTLPCMPKKGARGAARSASKRNSRSGRNTTSEEEMLHRQALSMVLQQHQLSQRFDGSMSRRIGSTSSRGRIYLKTSPMEGRSVAEFIGNIEIKKFVLVHGEGFGAWCWYKSISLLEESGLQPIALDLTGSGIDHTDTNGVATMAEYAKPLLDYLQSLPEDEKVILVGHSCGGASISYALEYYPKKISKAVFLSATMVSNGQRPFDVFSGELASAEVFMQESQLLSYGNGKDRSPTAFVFDKQYIKGLYFNNSPPKPIPLKPIMEKLSLTPEKYGAVKRYFVQTLDDHMLSPDIQEKLVRENPPHGVYKIKGSDHCPFFSKPQSLHKILLEIAQLP
ncbi:unnamed protein product [Spirodela intermedia]|uniref:AB hydrolase-1 domain-containing protein n=1 Tax=Spirodela intermedia TaxID=51605 RepID=A0A7I8IRI9_SPIIN|nr:unnamed protein product [Spirodela intermedia]CAA6660176.1 unnamed protein product [Spirodela intermedia]